MLKGNTTYWVEWDIQLTPAEIQVLFEGTSPLAIKPERIIFYTTDRERYPYTPRHIRWRDTGR